MRERLFREIEVIVDGMITARIVTAKCRRGGSGGGNSCCYFCMLYVREKEEEKN